MSTKPTLSRARWATTGDKIEPTSGRKDSGFEPGDRPPSQIFNWLLNQFYLWAEYLSDGALSGTHSINGTLNVTGAVDFDSDLNVDGGLTVDGDLTVDDIVADQITCGDIHTTDDQLCEMPSSAAQGFVDGGGTSAVYQVSGNAGLWNLQDAAGCDYPVLLRTGDRILSYSATGTQVSGSGFTVQLWKMHKTDASMTQIGSTQTSGTSNIVYTPGETGLAETVSADYNYVIRVKTPASAQSFQLGAAIGWDHP